MSTFQKKIEELYSRLPIATCLFSRDDEGNWQLPWMNSTATKILFDFELNEHPLFKVELMDALSKSAPTVFSYSFTANNVSYSCTATPNQDDILLQFVSESKSSPALHSVDESVEANDLIIQSLDVGLYDWDLIADSVQFNAKATRLFCHDVLNQGLNYENVMNCIHPQDQARVAEAIEEHFESGWPLKVSFRVTNKDGISEHVEMTGQALIENEQPVRLAGTLTDVTEQKIVEQQLKQREIFIEQLIDALPIGIYVKDSVGCYKFFNKQAEKNSGKLRSQMIGSTDFEIYPLEKALAITEQDKAIQLNNDITIYEKPLKEGDDLLWMLVGKVPMPVRKQNGEFENWLLSFALDISERKQMEEDLKSARNIAEQAAKAKADFLSVMSHEIRTPLNSVIGNAGLLLSEQLDDNLAKHIEMIKRSGEHLLYLINDILDFNKLEAGKVELEKRPFQLTQQIQTVLEMSATNAKLKHLDLKSYIDENLESYYQGDEGRLRQILLNLVSNAIKFTQQGSVQVKAELVSGTELIRFSVIDTGIGIAPENIGKLFSEFTQADSSTSRHFGGSGLGLSISKKLVEAMGGEIGVNSIEGQGSTFWFELALPKTEAPQNNSQQDCGCDDGDCQLNILVAEDNLSNQFLIKALLVKFGHEVTIANNGLEAYEMVQNRAFDLILMDMQMPEMDGLEATQQIRMLDGSESNIPIIALTANTHEEDYEAVMAAGMNDYLSKPVNIDALNAAIRKWGQPKA